MKNDPNTKIHEEEEIVGVVSSPIEDEWDNINGDLVLF
jgi:hypothetical protein